MTCKAGSNTLSLSDHWPNPDCLRIWHQCLLACLVCLQLWCAQLSRAAIYGGHVTSRSPHLCYSISLSECTSDFSQSCSKLCMILQPATQLLTLFPRVSWPASMDSAHQQTLKCGGVTAARPTLSKQVAGAAECFHRPSLMWTIWGGFGTLLRIGVAGQTGGIQSPLPTASMMSLYIGSSSFTVSQELPLINRLH